MDSGKRRANDRLDIVAAASGFPAALNNVENVQGRSDIAEMFKLLVAEIPENAERDLSVELDIFGPDIEVKRFAYHDDSEALVAACADVDCVLTDFVPFDQSVIEQLRKCRLISISATGFNFVDIEAAARHRISVCAIDEYCTNEVADHAMALMLALSRNLMIYHQQVEQYHRWQFDSVTGLRRMGDLTLGIIGLGRIGRAVATRATGFGMKVIGHDPYAKNANVTLCDLDSLLGESDIITLHCNVTPENHEFLDRTAFEIMSRKPILINVARGALINEHDLVDALDRGLIRAAGLDVLAAESPNLPASNLLGRNNVIITPHVAFYSDASMLENRAISASNIRHHLDGNHSAVRKYVHRAIEE